MGKFCCVPYLWIPSHCLFSGAISSYGNLRNHLNLLSGLTNSLVGYRILCCRSLFFSILKAFFRSFHCCYWEIHCLFLLPPPPAPTLFSAVCGLFFLEAFRIFISEILWCVLEWILFLILLDLQRTLHSGSRCPSVWGSYLHYFLPAVCWLFVFPVLLVGDSPLGQ